MFCERRRWEPMRRLAIYICEFILAIILTVVIGSVCYGEKRGSPHVISGMHPNTDMGRWPEDNSVEEDVEENWTIGDSEPPNFKKKKDVKSDGKGPSFKIGSMRTREEKRRDYLTSKNQPPTQRARPRPRNKRYSTAGYGHYRHTPSCAIPRSTPRYDFTQPTMTYTPYDWDAPTKFASKQRY